MATLIGALYLLANGWKFGTRREGRSKKRRSKIEFVRGVASSWREAKGASLAYRIIWEDMREKVCQAVGKRKDSASAELAAELGRMGGASEASIRARIERLDGAIDGKMTDKQLFEFLREMGELGRIQKQGQK